MVASTFRRRCPWYDLVQNGHICCAGSLIHDGTATIDVWANTTVFGHWRFASGLQSLRLYHCFCTRLRRWSARDERARGPPSLMHSSPVGALAFQDTWHVSGLRGPVRWTSPPGCLRHTEMVASLGQGPLHADHHVSVAARFLFAKARRRWQRASPEVRLMNSSRLPIARRRCDVHAPR